MDTAPAPNLATTETPRPTSINPPTMEKPKLRGRVGKTNAVNGKKPLQQSINPKKSNNHDKKKVIKCGNWNIRRGLRKLEMDVKRMEKEEKLDSVVFSGYMKCLPYSKIFTLKKTLGLLTTLLSKHIFQTILYKQPLTDLRKHTSHGP